MSIFIRPFLPRRCLVAAMLSICLTGSLAADVVHEMEGIASWYGGKFQGRLTASGEVFDTLGFTAAHKTLPFNTIVDVTNMANGRHVQVRINDRGPFVTDRIIDLSRAAADMLEMTGAGIARVRLRVVSTPDEPLRSIQVGAFEIQRNAESARQRVLDAGIDAVTEVRDRDTTPVFRVVVPDVPEHELPATLAALDAIGFPSVLVRSR